jgi:hypothetical protein
MVSDVAALTDEGKPFHALDAATGNTRSPRVDRCVGVTTSKVVSDERRRRLSVVHWCKYGMLQDKLVGLFGKKNIH